MTYISCQCFFSVVNNIIISKCTCELKDRMNLQLDRIHITNTGNSFTGSLLFLHNEGLFITNKTNKTRISHFHYSSLTTRESARRSIKKIPHQTCSSFCSLFWLTRLHLRSFNSKIWEQGKKLHRCAHTVYTKPAITLFQWRLKKTPTSFFFGCPINW